MYSLKHMLLCKIMVSQADDIAGIISSKAGVYQGPEVDAMKAVADAQSKQSLKLFEAGLGNFDAQLDEDLIVNRHLSSLYDTNLCRLIAPFSRVDIAHIGELPDDHVEKKLSKMMLGKRFAGTLDLGAGCLIILGAVYGDTLDLRK